MHNTVVIVDSNTELSRAYQKRLALDGINVVVFDKASKAIDYIRSLPVSIIISEYQLPDMSALDLIDIVRTDLGHVSMPCLVLTNQDSFSSVQALSDYVDCEVVIKKAVSATALSKKIQGLINTTS